MNYWIKYILGVKKQADGYILKTSKVIIYTFEINKWRVK